jgi:hypothetical protein
MQVLVVAVLLLPAIGTAPDLCSSVREAAALREHSPQQRKHIVYGTWMAVVEEIRARVPAGGSVDVVMLTPQARETAVFAGAELPQRDVRFFDGWQAWRARERATFFHDDRAANAPAGPPPRPASLVVTIDSEMRIVTAR